MGSIVLPLALGPGVTQAATASLRACWSGNRFQLIAYAWLLIISYLATGCIAGTRTLTAEDVGRLHRVAVVPMESPPLEIHPDVAVQLSTLGGSLVLAPAPIGTAGSIVAVISGIVFLAQVPQAAKDSAIQAESVEHMLKTDADWQPSVVLARHLATRLTESARREAILVNTPRRYPGLERRERTVMMRNWWVPIRDKWYNVDTSPIDYSEFAVWDVDAVLEVGVAGYTVTNQSSVASDVLIKLTDPKNGALLARTRQYTLSCGTMRRPFENGAQELKSTITMCLRELGDRALKELALLL